MSRQDIITFADETDRDADCILLDTPDGRLVARAAEVCGMTPLEVLTHIPDAQQEVVDNDVETVTEGADELMYHQFLQYGVLPSVLRQHCRDLVTPTEVKAKTTA